MGVNLDGSDLSRESLKEMEKFINFELLKYLLRMLLIKYKLDLYSDEEKDQCCMKLMVEYKMNKSFQDVKVRFGSQIYRLWDF